MELNQIVGFQMYKTLESKYEKVDVLIKPDLKNYNVVSFDKLNEIMEEGKIASQEKIEEIKAIAHQQIPKEKIKYPWPENFRITPEKLFSNSANKPNAKFRLSGVMDTTVCSFNDDYHGSVIIEVLYIYMYK